MAAESQPTVHRGVVKSVLSGDTVVIRGKPVGGPPPEKVLSLAGISAPRLARRPTAGQEAEADEPFAWEAREFLRSKLVGKEVSFVIEYSVPTGRDYGHVYLGSGPSRENVTMSLIQTGFASLKEGRAVDDPATQALAALEQHAKTIGIGVHSSEEIRKKSVRRVQWTLADPEAFVKKLNFKPTKVIIEHVQNATTFRVTILPMMQSTSLSLTGIRGAGFRRDASGKDVADVYAAEAKYFTEVRLLQRTVDVVFEGVSGQGLLGTILHPKGNISELLLAEGFAKIMDSSFVDVRGDKARMRAAEAAAKARLLRIWKEYKKAAINIPEADRVFTATVIEVVNPERLKARKANGDVVEIALSSLRQPRRAKNSDGADKADAGAGAGADGENAQTKRRPKPLFEVPYMLEAREMLRSKLVGKQAQFSVDYVKPAEDRFPERVCATVSIGGVNVAEALIAKGLASVLRHDEFRAAAYDNMMALEKHAQKNKVGMHSGAGGLVRVADVNSKAMASTFLSSMQRQGKVSAVVEYVSSGSRLRVYIPRDSCQATFLLAGVSCPRTSYQDKAGDPYAEEALAFTRDMCFQRDVELEVHDTDARGNFVGQVFVGGRSLGVELLQNGFGEKHSSAHRYGIESELTAAEDMAKKTKVGMWEGYDEAAVEAARLAAAGENGEAGEAGASVGRTEEVIVTEIVDAITFYAQRTGAAEELSQLSTDLNAALSASATPLEAVKRNVLCAGKFTADDAWYRARVVSVDKESGKVTVRYVDYGNTEEVDKSRLAALPEEHAALPEQARRMALTLLAPPPSDYADEAKDVLEKGIINMTYNCEVQGKDVADGVTTEFVRLVHAESGDDVAKTMLAMGYATVGRTRERHLYKLKDELKLVENEAKAAHEGMWMYGDITEDPKEI